jgi:hypothetical protein
MLQKIGARLMRQRVAGLGVARRGIGGVRHGGLLT